MGKLLNILGVPESVQENLPPEIFQGEQMINVMQTVYESAPESNKKNALANAISESVRLLLLEIEKYKGEKTEKQPEPEQPKIKEQEELPFKVGDKFCMKSSKYPYLIESIDVPNGMVKISGFNNAGDARVKDFEIKWIVSQINNKTLYPCPEKVKKTRQPKTKPTTPQPKPQKPTPPQPTPPQTTPPQPTPPQPKPQKPTPKIHDAETTKKIREIQEQIDEINDTLVAFEQGTEDYEELISEINKLDKQIKDLKK